ncbi:MULTISPECIES: acyl-CoA thioesterase [unclassified Rathayibacter]|uniref:acyl-CoA thioesterase n=1 Tax=unclassified Rathayibacter TaxID=2609250 RepID=UPI00188B4598|nr:MULTISPECIES: acyl-CoA thioesterase [unclassified Rathayibacter]MBF4461821.1 acyl-CoA thioesterase [Rathayibacter sp. VKM Ac-2879]MBF4503234.1 acyl-CoA thioesterase [Rathayibacter sp. VKM Ac-2878]
MDDRITLRFLAAPQDATADGRSAQAGRVLEWIDKAGYACAVGWSGGYCVTAYVGNVHFTRPITVGNLIEASAQIIHTGRTSMHVLVRVAQADPRTGRYEDATHCLLIFVAVDDEKRPRAVPEWGPRSLDDLALAEGAEARIRGRRRLHEVMQAQQYTEAGTGLRTVFRFLAAPGDVNWGGNAHGGIVMRWIDEAADAVAQRWCGRDAVAVYSGGIHFYRPVRIGHLVEVEARLIHTGPHSMHLAVHVRSGDPRTGDLELTTQCMSVFVARGADGAAVAIPPLEVRSEEDRRLEEHARELIRLRAELPPLPLGTLVAR